MVVLLLVAVMATGLGPQLSSHFPPKHGQLETTGMGGEECDVRLSGEDR